MRYLIITLLIGIIAACNNKQEKKEKGSKVTSAVTPVKVAAKIDSVTKEFPVAALMPYDVFTVGSFHHDEAAPGLQKRLWIGLFKNLKGEYYTAPTSMKVKQVKDEIVDEDGQKTGWQVSAREVKDSCLVLVSRIDLPEKKVVKVLTTPKEIVPGKEYSYQYKGITYRVYSIAKINGSLTSGYSLNNYRVFCTAVVKGRPYNQLLVAHAQADYGSTISFIGDVDGDDIPDILMNTSAQENVVSTTLYLSRHAATGHLFQIAGMHTIVGC